MWLTGGSTLEMKEKQEERGSRKTLCTFSKEKLKIENDKNGD
jgi:hypothetical protein